MPLTLNGTTGVAGIDGSASTPSIQGTDTNTGVWFPAADTVAIATGGTERMRVDSSGNVGIGQTPSSYGATVRNVEAYIAGASAFTLISSNTASVKTEITSSETSLIGQVGTRTNHPLVLKTNDAEAARIDIGGNFLVGTSSQNPIASRVTGVALQSTFSTFNGASNGMAVGFKANSGSSITFYTDNGSSFVPAGNITSSGSSTAYNTSSDYRLKENLRPLSGSLDKLAQVRLVSFDWKEGYGQGSADGVIAHELAEIFPLAVNGQKDALDEDGRIKPQGVDYSKLVPYLIDAIQELKAEIAALKGAA